MHHRTRIDFERTGGIAGIRMRATIDSAALEPERARQLGDLIDEARVFGPPFSMDPPPPSRAPENNLEDAGAASGDVAVAGGSAAAGADRFVYKVTVERDGLRRTVEIGESTAPETLWPLLEWLSREARSV